MSCMCSIFLPETLSQFFIPDLQGAGAATKLFLYHTVTPLHYTNLVFQVSCQPCPAGIDASHLLV